MAGRRGDAEKTGSRGRRAARWRSERRGRRGNKNEVEAPGGEETNTCWTLQRAGLATAERESRQGGDSRVALTHWAGRARPSRSIGALTPCSVCRDDVAWESRIRRPSGAPSRSLRAQLPPSALEGLVWRRRNSHAAIGLAATRTSADHTMRRLRSRDRRAERCSLVRSRGWMILSGRIPRGRRRAWRLSRFFATRPRDGWRRLPVHWKRPR